MNKRKGRNMGTAVGFLVLLGVALSLYVRLAPINPARWHHPVEASADEDLAGGAVRVLPGNQDTLARIDAAARDLPRTRVLAGGLRDGRITYVTRSRVFGFPDLTTIEVSGDQIKMFGRLKFGRSDLGVNRDRLERLMAAAQGG